LTDWLLLHPLSFKFTHEIEDCEVLKVTSHWFPAESDWILIGFPDSPVTVIVFVKTKVDPLPN
jgi:hypothetical protein